MITWLRLGCAARKACAGVVPDMTAVGKICGGGSPIAAFGGRADVMGVLAPTGATFTGGTHGGNPFAVGMAHRVLDLLEAHPEYYGAMDRGARAWRRHSRRPGGARLSLAVVQREIHRRFQVPPGRPNRNYDDARAANNATYAAYYHAMLARGILLPPSQNEVMFLCTEHTDADIDETLEAIAGALPLG